MNNSYITIIKEKRTALSRKRVPLNQNECTDDFRIGVPFEQNLHTMLRRYELTDEEWLRIEPLLPPENTGKQGRPRKDNRIIMNGIVWLARSGAPWRDLPERYGSWKTVYSRFRKWIDDGILDNIFRILSLEAELEELSIDASIIQAHQHSAGAKKGGLQMKSGIAVEEPAPKSMRQ